MLLREVVLASFLLALARASYNVTDPQIEIFTPKGFRISIEDQPGIKSVEFHVNIEKGALQKFFFKDVHRKRAGRWTFDQRKTRIETGSVINYWFLVITSHNAYRVNGDSFLVTDMNSIHTPHKIPLEPTPGKTTAPTAPTAPIAPIAPIAPTAPIAPSKPMSHCERIILNTTQTLMSLQADVEALTKLNQQLKIALQKYPDAKKLTLSGRIPDDDPMMTVKFILWEKLDLDPKIVSAVRNSDHSITFEVPTTSEKFKILDVAKYKLMDTKIFIF